MKAVGAVCALALPQVKGLWLAERSMPRPAAKESMGSSFLSLSIRADKHYNSKPNLKLSFHSPTGKLAALKKFVLHHVLDATLQFDMEYGYLMWTQLSKPSKCTVDDASFKQATVDDITALTGPVQEKFATEGLLALAQSHTNRDTQLSTFLNQNMATHMRKKEGPQGTATSFCYGEITSVGGKATVGVKINTDNDENDFLQWLIKLTFEPLSDQLLKVINLFKSVDVLKQLDEKATTAMNKAEFDTAISSADVETAKNKLIAEAATIKKPDEIEMNDQEFKDAKALVESAFHSLTMDRLRLVLLEHNIVLDCVDENGKINAESNGHASATLKNILLCNDANEGEVCKSAEGTRVNGTPDYTTFLLKDNKSRTGEAFTTENVEGLEKCPK